ncbi:MAG: hypothetical protein M3Y87_23780 [Myxococcota bacterium]|nr:hypothetical protein [Myxococcota bacterium]
MDASLRLSLPPDLTLAREPAPPTGYRDVARGETLVLERRWSTGTPWHAMPALIPWLGIGVALSALALRASGEDPRSSFLLVGVLLGWVALTMLLGWEGLAHAVNRTRIAVGDEGLRVTHGPLPLASARPWGVARAELAGFEIEHEPRGDLGLVHWVTARRRDGCRMRMVELADAHAARSVRDALAERLAD